MLHNLIAGSTWTSCLVGCLEDTATWADHSPCKREADLGVMELSDVWSLALRCLDGSCLNDRDGTMSCTVSTAHLLVHLFYGAIKSGIPVLFISVMDTSTGVVSNPNSVILNGRWILLENLVHCKNLTIGLLHTTKLSQKVPELRLSLDLISSPHLHSVNLWILILLSWDVTSNNLELTVQELQKQVNNPHQKTTHPHTTRDTDKHKNAFIEISKNNQEPGEYRATRESGSRRTRAIPLHSLISCTTTHVHPSQE